MNGVGHLPGRGALWDDHSRIAEDAEHEAHMTTAPWHARQAERDLVGAAVGWPWAARLVAGVLDLDAIYDFRLRRLIETAIAAPEQPDADLSPFDEGGVLGPKLTTWTFHLWAEELGRVVYIANVADESVMFVAEMVADIPCWPSPTSVGMWADEVHQAADMRQALSEWRAIKDQVLAGHRAVVQAIVSRGRAA